MFFFNFSTEVRLYFYESASVKTSTFCIHIETISDSAGEW